ncbi:hypothetical protein P167DRAFT_53539 [Morchella conica CCBAS932]|uniref:Uncharacterized protein n=1 Tax=Morchella conica CCBAS932 TaxID=1392247 RepID=A0A3N4KYF9_9PEZI|nr:hypothetical protein P167DRAFT_53539 [Morchella conica CCBAS932]
MQELGASPILGTLHVSWNLFFFFSFFFAKTIKKIGFIPPPPGFVLDLLVWIKQRCMASPVYYHRESQFNVGRAGHGMAWAGRRMCGLAGFGVCLSVGSGWLSVGRVVEWLSGYYSL